MPIYGIRITRNGVDKLSNESAYDGTLSIRRLVILTASNSYKGKWVEWNQIFFLIEKAKNELSTQNKTLSNQLEAMGSSQMLDDILWLSHKNLIEVSRYIAPNGHLMREKPPGMTFRYNDKELG